jgi:hypothetical protein
MADYSRAEVTVSYGATSALQTPDLEKTFTSVPTSPTKFKFLKFSAATGGGTTVDLGEFTTIQELYFYNSDSSNYVTGTYREDGDSGAADRTFKCVAGQWLKLVQLVPGNDLVCVANSSACVCEVLVIGT